MPVHISCYNVNDGTALSNIPTVTVTVQTQSPSNSLDITIDGNLNDWANAASFGSDPENANNLNDSIDSPSNHTLFDLP